MLSIGQFNQWVGSQLMAGGLVQIWPGTPVAAPLFTDRRRRRPAPRRPGRRQHGAPADGFMPGMDVRARLTVVGDGPVGAVGQASTRVSALPEGHARREWALGMKFVIELPEDSTTRLEPGTVWHTFGYPEPEIFGFLYVHPDRLVSVGIFVPSWMGDPARTAYRYLQHYIQHPALWRYLKDGTLRSWGAKSLEESGRHGEPFLYRRRLRPHRRGLRLHQHAHRLRRGRGLDHRRATRRSRRSNCCARASPSRSENLAATYENAPPRKLGGARRARGRERPQRLPSRHSSAA